MFANLALLVVLSSKVSADDRVERIENRGIDTLLVQDDRFPIAWFEMIYSADTSTSFWTRNDADRVWSWMFSRARVDRTSTAQFTPWVNEFGYGLSVEMLASEQKLVARDLQQMLQAPIDGEQLDIRAFNRYVRGQLRFSPTAALFGELADIWYSPRDPRHADAILSGGRVHRANNLKTTRAVLVDTILPVVGFAGDISEAEARSFMDTALRFGHPEDVKQKARVQPLRPADKRPEEEIVQLRFAQEAILSWSREGLALADSRAPAAYFADRIAVRRLTEQLRETRGDTYNVSTTGLLSLHPGYYAILTTTSASRVVEHASSVRAVLAELASDGVTKEEVERMRARLQAEQLHRTESPHDLLWDHLFVDLVSSSAPSLPALTRAALASTVEEIDNFARSFYAPDEFVHLRVQPRE